MDPPGNGRVFFMTFNGRLALIATSEADPSHS